jgi:hypothetical protein
MKKFKVEIEIDDDAKIIKIKDSREHTAAKEFKGGVHLVAADGKNKIYYVLSYGASADIGWALAQAINDGWKLPFVKRMFYHFTEWINKFIINKSDAFDLSDPEDIDEMEKIFSKWTDGDDKKPTFN